jgi:HTH-type transcriptional regulator / antitoxin HigA
MVTTAYANLLKEAQPQIIRDEKTHKRALGWIDQLMKKGKLSAAEEKLLELLSKLVCDYEGQLYPAPNVPPREILHHFLENSGMSQAEFSRTIGLPRSTVSEVLKGKRNLSVENAFRLAEYFHVDPTLFLERR